MTQRDLGKAIGAQDTAVSRMFRPGSSSRLVPAVARELGIPIPAGSHDRIMAELVELLARCSEDDRRTVLALARTIVHERRG